MPEISKPAPGALNVLANEPEIAERTVRNMLDELKTCHKEVERADNKAIALLAGASGVVAIELGVWVGVAGRLGTGFRVGLALSVVAFSLAAVCFGVAIRPRLSRRTDDSWGLMKLARMDPDEILTDAVNSAMNPTDHGKELSRALHDQALRGCRKHRWARHGGDVSLVGLILAGLAAATTLM
jgi:hypothetical protein